MRKDFWVGTAPFCKGECKDCAATPGYVCTGTDKKGDGFRCWTGKKAHCEFNPEEFKKTAIYKQTMKEGEKDENFMPEFKWFGTSPICNVSYGSVANEGYYPVKTDKSGDGAPCLVGQKILGMKPRTDKQLEEVERLKNEYLKKNKMFDELIDIFIKGTSSSKK